VPSFSREWRPVSSACGITPVMRPTERYGPQLNSVLPVLRWCPPWQQASHGDRARFELKAASWVRGRLAANGLLAEEVATPSPRLAFSKTANHGWAFWTFQMESGGVMLEGTTLVGRFEPCPRPCERPTISKRHSPMRAEDGLSFPSITWRRGSARAAGGIARRWRSILASGGGGA
jgi:hypothetical protein